MFMKPKVDTNFALASVKDLTLGKGGKRNLETDEIGVELELEGTSLADAFFALPLDVQKYWKMDTDGSLRDGGKEFTFKQALNRTVAKQAIKDFYTTFEAKGGIDNSSRCSTHMHLNFQHMSMLQVYSFITLFSVLEWPLFKRYAPERLGNSYCVPMFNLPGYTKHINQSLKAAKFAPTQKYRALNTGPLTTYGSIECRILGGSSNADKPLEWMDILLELYDHIKGNPKVTPDIILDVDNWPEFLEKTFPKIWKGIKDVTNVEEMIEFGLYQAQEFAYAVDWSAVKTAEPPKNVRTVDPFRSGIMDELARLPVNEPPEIYPGDDDMDDYDDDF